MSVSKAVDWISDHETKLIDVANSLWNFAEIALEEQKSALLMQDILQENGFAMQTGLADMPTAFKAVWGKGSPVVGFLAEYDALPGLSQRVSTAYEPIVEGGPGHGCQHHLLGTAALGAALGLKKELESEGLTGTVVLYGCPAEEIMTGKIFMAKAGLFRDLDVALTWHPMSVNGVIEHSFFAMNSVKFGFYGTTSHASAAPEQGRSALDAVELMNTGVNYLREHVPSDVRIHYTITHGGGEPNVVPRYAQTWYYIRAPRRDTVISVYERIINIAKGAGLMTDTQLEIDFQSGCYHSLINGTLNELLHECLMELPPPVWSDEELDFAKKLTETFLPAQKEAQLSLMGADAHYHQYLHEGVLPLTGNSRQMPFSSDVSDVSWITPTAQLMTCCQPLGTAAHTWQTVAAGGMGIGHKGMLYAARALALAGSKLVRDPALLQKTRAEFDVKTAGKTYQCAVPDGVKPGGRKA